MKCFNGLSVVNVELTSCCNKNCWMCGRRKLEKQHPELCKWGDMDFDLVRNIAKQLPPNIIAQFHNNGEPLLYPYLGQALRLFDKQIKTLDTNGKLLIEKADDIIDNLDTLTISVIENDPEGDEQYEIVKNFLAIKKDRKPFMIYRLLGDVGLIEESTCSCLYNSVPNYISKYEKINRWYEFSGLVATRVLHRPEGSFGYTKKVIIPEHGICLDLLTHLVIDRYGDVYPCVRYNPNKYNKLGNLGRTKLIDLFNSLERLTMIQLHKEGRRKELDLCDKCEFYGCPTG